jgi:O-antigen/teichoic acid export membrane protein
MTARFFSRFASILNRRLGFFLFAQISQSGVSFILLPIYARFLSQDDFGLMSLFIVSSQVIGTLLTLNFAVPLSLGYLSLDYSSYRLLRKKLFFWIYQIAIILLVLIAIFQFFILQKDADYLYIFLVGSSVFSWRYLVLSELRMSSNARHFFWLTVGHTFVPYSAGCLISYLYNLTAVQLISIIVIIQLCTNIVFFFVLRPDRSEKLKIQNFELKSYVISALKMFPHNLGILLLSFSDRLIIGMAIGLGSLATYQLALVIGNFGIVFIGILSNTFTPLLYSTFLSRRVSQFCALVKKLFFSVVLLVSFSILLLPSLKFLIPANYDFSLVMKCAIIIELAALPYFVYTISLIPLFLTERFLLISIMTIVTSIIVSVLTWFASLEFGILGASFSFLIGTIFQSILFLVPAIKVFKKFSDGRL